MFNIILPKPCEIFAKFLLKICQNLVKISQGFSTNTILAHSDRMIYFRENSTGPHSEGRGKVMFSHLSVRSQKGV